MFAIIILVFGILALVYHERIRTWGELAMGELRAFVKEVGDGGLAMPTYLVWIPIATLALSQFLDRQTIIVAVIVQVALGLAYILKAERAEDLRRALLQRRRLGALAGVAVALTAGGVALYGIWASLQAPATSVWTDDRFDLPVTVEESNDATSTTVATPPSQPTILASPMTNEQRILAEASSEMKRLESSRAEYAKRIDMLERSLEGSVESQVRIASRVESAADVQRAAKLILEQVERMPKALFSLKDEYQRMVARARSGQQAFRAAEKHWLTAAEQARDDKDLPLARLAFGLAEVWKGYADRVEQAVAVEPSFEEITIATDYLRRLHQLLEKVVAFPLPSVSESISLDRHVGEVAKNVDRVRRMMHEKMYVLAELTLEKEKKILAEKHEALKDDLVIHEIPSVNETTSKSLIWKSKPRDAHPVRPQSEHRGTARNSENSASRVVASQQTPSEVVTRRPVLSRRPPALSPRLPRSSRSGSPSSGVNGNVTGEFVAGSEWRGISRSEYPARGWCRCVLRITESSGGKVRGTMTITEAGDYQSVHPLDGVATFEGALVNDRLTLDFRKVRCADWAKMLPRFTFSGAVSDGRYVARMTPGEATMTLSRTR